MVIGACLWIPKSLWHDLGGFPEWFHTLAEDMYLCTLARVQGYPVTALSTSGYRHWVGRSIGGGRINQGRLVTTYRRRYYSERNKTYVMALCYPHLMFYLLMPLHILVLAFEGVALSLVKRDFQPWQQIYGRVFRALWQERHRLSKARVRVQRKYRIGLKRFCAAFVCYPYKIKMLFAHGLPLLK